MRRTSGPLLRRAARAVTRAAVLSVAAFALVAPASAGDDDKTPPEPKAVEIATTGGAKLAAEVSEPAGGGETKPAVVAVHGEGTDHTMWTALAARLVACGMSVVAIDVKPVSPDGTAPPDWTGAVDDALAAVKWARGTLLCDGKKIVLVGCGAGGNAAVAATRKDTGVLGVLVLGPLPGAGGVSAGVVGWDGRPIALVAGAKSPSLGELKKMAAPLVKQARAETILIDAAAGHGADLLAESADAVLETAQWIHGWIGRPVFDLSHAGNVKESSGAGHVVASQSSCGLGMGSGGGISLTGMRAPQEIDGIGLMVDQDVKSAKLTDRARRLAITPGKGKSPTVVVKVERWQGKAWKAEATYELSDCGGFGKDANVSTYGIWLPPRVFGATPFSDVAATTCFMEKGKFTWEDAKKEAGGIDLGHFGDTGSGLRDRAPFKIADPSTWQQVELR